MNLVKLLFTEATALVMVDKATLNQFATKRGIRHNYPLVPSLFMIVT